MAIGSLSSTWQQQMYVAPVVAADSAGEVMRRQQAQAQERRQADARIENLRQVSTIGRVIDTFA